MVATTTSNEKLLTEAEILAMPEDDYMNPAQLEFFRDRLTKMREELLENAASTGANLRENELVADPADRATVEEEHALELRVRDRERKLLKKIDEALGRIAEGDYGWCEETGDPIGIGRLLARPTATLSIDAQERRERTQKLYGE
ncbi:MAG: RNA polymerase-binding protein DksA [Proteobacteria bacterium]|uniref:RNA polymerase-binding protein DksA n=1 Tax=Zoogloea sp. TaxID=49181 RepID=UPI0035B27BC0|nr:RNA polymerase-binding protein DksA [Pseudomonadota bacterium]